MAEQVHNPRHSLRHGLRGILRRGGVAATALSVPVAALAGPSGGQVVDGQATISTPDPGTTVVDQATRNAVIDWQSFSVGSSEYVLFQQPDSSSVVLNRVIGGNASSILGSIQANGQVFLVNPNGIYFGQGASIDVQGLLATTMDISNDDFMAGNYVFHSTAPDSATGSVVNDGHIGAHDGGYVVLAGDYASNDGLVTARSGHVILASGQKFTLDVAGDGLVNFAVNEKSLSSLAGVNNAGSILADGSVVVMTAKVADGLVPTAVNNDGLIQAHSIQSRNGQIYLSATGGDIQDNGTLDASGTDGAAGGRVQVIGDHDVNIGNGADIAARGDGAGSGGSLRLIATDTLRLDSGASVDAAGGSQGTGGYVEVSGHGGLSLRGTVQSGQGGTLFVDPTTLSISSYGGAPTSGAPSIVSAGWISSHLNGGSNVTLAATSSINHGGGVTSLNASGTGNLRLAIGNISTGVGGCGSYFGAACVNPVSDPVLPSSGGAINLSGMDINIAGDFQATASNGTVTASNITANNITIAGSTINTSALTATNSVTLNANGTAGDITIGSNATSFNGSAVTASNGSINITANRGDVLVGQLTAGTNINVLASGPGGRVEVVSNLTASTFTGASVNAGGAVSLRGSGSGSFGGRIEAGNITGSNITVSGNRFGSSPAGSPHVRLGNLAATGSSANGNISVDANNSVTSTSTASMQLGNATGNQIRLTTDGGNISAGSLIASNSTGPAYISALASNGFSAGGNIKISGNVTANGRALASGSFAGPFLQPLAAGINLQTWSGGAGNVTVIGGISATATRQSFVLHVAGETVTNDVSGSGGIATVHVAAGGSGQASVGSSITVQGPDAQLGVSGGTVKTGAVTVQASGHTFTLFQHPLFSLGASYHSNNTAGIAEAYFGSNSPATPTQSVTVSGPINVTGKGRAELGIQAAGQISAGSITVNATAANFTRSGTFASGSTGQFRLGVPGRHPGEIPIIDNGTLHVGAAHVSMIGGVSSGQSSGGSHVSRAQSAAINGGITINGAGGAGGEIEANDIAITGGITVSAGAGSASGSGQFQFVDPVSRASYGVVSQTSGSFGSGGFDLTGSSASGHSITVGGNISLTGLTAGGGMRGNNITVQGLSATGTGGNLHVQRSYTALGTNGSDYQTSYQGPGQITGFQIQGTGAVNIQGAASAQGKGFAGLLLSGGSLTTRGLSVTGSASPTTILDTRVSSTPTTGSAGGAVLMATGLDSSGNPVAATINGNATVMADGTAHLGIDGSISGRLDVQAGGGVDNAPPPNVGQIDIGRPGRSNDLTSLPTLNATASAVRITAGGNINLSGTSLGIGTGSAGVAGDSAVTGYLGLATTNPNGVFQAGGTLNLGNLAQTGDYLLLQANTFGTFGSLSVPNSALVQFAAMNAGNTLSINPTVGGTQPTRIGASEHLQGLGSAALAFGLSSQSGGIAVAETGGVNLSGHNVVLANAGSIKGVSTLQAGALGLLGGSSSTIDITATTPTVFVGGGGTTNLQLNTPATATNGPMVAFGGQTFGDVGVTFSGGGSVVSNLAAASGTFLANAGSLDMSGLTFNITGQLDMSATQDIGIGASTFNAGTMTVTAGGNITDAPVTAIMGARRTQATTGAGTITANALAMLAGGNVDLQLFTFNIGSGTITGINGDAQLISALNANGVPVTSLDPNGTFVAGGNLNLGTVSLTGDYLLLQADTLVLGGPITGPGSLLVQMTPFTATNSISVVNATGGSGNTVLSNSGTFSQISASTLAIGSSTQTGAIDLGADGTIDLGSTNFIVGTTGTVTGLDKIVSTGLVSDLASLLGGGFKQPTINEIDPGAGTVDNGTSLDTSGDDDDDNKKKTGSQGDTGTGNTNDNELIKHQTGDSSLVCQ